MENTTRIVAPPPYQNGYNELVYNEETNRYEIKYISLIGGDTVDSEEYI